MQTDELRKNLVQVGILFLAYYAIPAIIREFIGPPTDDLSRYVPIIVEVLIAGLMIYKLFELRPALEAQTKSLVERISKQKLDEKKENALATHSVTLMYVVVISIIGLPIIEYFVSSKIMTVIKIIIVAYCLFLLYQLWGLFSSPTKASQSPGTRSE